MRSVLRDFRRFNLFGSETNLECFGGFILQSKIMSSIKQIYYSDKYYDDEYEYRHVMLPKDIAKLVPKGKLMDEREWRSIGVQQSQGWVHYMKHDPEPHILMFRRKRTQPISES